jgi:hypothetical protein
MLFNPSFGDDIYHNHPAGMWMFNYKYMHMGMDGLRDGTTDVATSSVGNGRGLPYDDIMMVPTSMAMDMHMVMAMYGFNDKLTGMVMVNYLETKMDMLMDMSPNKLVKKATSMDRQGDMSPNGSDMTNMYELQARGAGDSGISKMDTMRSSGLGDTEVRGVYKFTETLNASLGLSLPTGDIEQTYEGMKKSTHRAPYDMQLGSGTFDLKPAVTANFLSADALWNWGGQAMATLHLGNNENDYSLGDSLKLNTWLQRALGSAATWIRVAYSNTGSINGHDNAIQKSLDDKNSMALMTSFMAETMPDANPNNYGGEKIDGFIGVSLPLGPFSLGVEGGIPFYQNLNGLQMKNDWYLTAGLQAMF